MKKVIELIRVSTEGQAASDRASIPAQRSVNRQTCAQYGLEIVRTIEITDVSGASVLLAPEMHQLIELMKAPDIDGVVAREFSRLIRPENFNDYGLLQEFANSKTLLYLPDGPIDFGNKNGRFLGLLRAGFAGMERTDILERVWTAKEEKRRRGELAQSHVVLPWGVGYDPEFGFHYKPETGRLREAFKDFLSGKQNYGHLAQRLGVTPRGMHSIMRNPIWMGWRVIDKKRDPDPRGRYAGKQGRQSDRRKIRRQENEIIRIRVIEEPLISEAEFRAVQAAMDLKQKRHWRSQPNYEHRFTYHGFLTCSRCGDPVHTCLARRDYYACRSRRGKKHSCDTKYMPRERLETILDEIFARYLVDPTFVEKCVMELASRSQVDEAAATRERLQKELQSLEARRDRTIDCYVDGSLTRQERDRRLAGLDLDIQKVKDRLADQPAVDDLDLNALVQALSILAEWKFWNREQKRVLLATLTPDIRVADCLVEAIGIDRRLFSNESTPMDKGSSPPPT